MMLKQWLLLSSFVSALSFDLEEDTVLPSSCQDLEDGIYWLKLLEGDDYPPVELECSNGYIILDHSKDSNLENYFSSFNYWHYDTAGPSNNDYVNWQDWYLPSQSASEIHNFFNFLVSPSCDVCDETDISTNELNIETSYYMTGNLFGCYWLLKGQHMCDMDDNTYECYNCPNLKPATLHDYAIEEGTLSGTGSCAVLLRKPSAQVVTSHDVCTSTNYYSYKPSLGTNGKFCACVKPSDINNNNNNNNNNNIPKNIKISESDKNVILEKMSKNVNFDNKEDSSSSTDDNDGNTLLYQKDFLDGTYRITKSGTYTIMEDIEFDFNSNDYNNGDWFPLSTQSDEYMGSNDFRDAYFMGFFAGITIECDNVILDLNNHMLYQSNNFYIKQRWFSLIELSNQPFMPGQGPGFFGAKPTTNNNIEILNGILGLTSHHGIHGNQVKNVNIHDITIKEFETHGIQINGFENLVLSNIEIMESSGKAYFKGNYFHARLLVPRLKLVYQELLDNDSSDMEITTDLENEVGKIVFNKNKNDDDDDDIDIVSDTSSNERVAYLSDIIDTLETEMDLVFSYVENIYTYGVKKANRLILKEISKSDDSDKMEILWNEAKELFINENGIPYGASIHGIFLNANGASVFTMSQSEISDINGISDNAILENIKIHDLKHNMEEYVRFHIYETFLANPFNAIIAANKVVNDINDITKSYYVGNTLTDGYFILDKLSNNFGYLGLQHIEDTSRDIGLLQWVLGDMELTSDFSLACNADVMTHSGKGIFGIRIEGVTNVQLNNIEIYNLYDETPLGNTICGEYSVFDDAGGGHFSQKYPTMIGFTGNMVHGISISSSQITKFENINVNNIESSYGLAYGIAIWQTSEIDISGNIEISNIKAGTELDNGALGYDDRPNRAPEACGVRVYWEYDGSKPTISMSSSDDSDDSDTSAVIKVSCISGHAQCFNSDGYGVTTLGESYDCDNNLIKDNIDIDTSKQLFYETSQVSSLSSLSASVSVSPTVNYLNLLNSKLIATITLVFVICSLIIGVFYATKMNLIKQRKNEYEFISATSQAEYGTI